MSKHVTRLETQCSICNAPMELIHIKNPWVDDCDEQCTNVKCKDHGSAERGINAYAKNQAKRDSE